MSANPVVNNIRIIPRTQDFLERNTGSSGELYFNKDSNSLRVYNGSLRGGHEVISEYNLTQYIAQKEIATVKYDVTVENQGSGNKYVLNGTYYTDLSFVVGYTYIFDQTDLDNLYYPNAEGTVYNEHPLHFSSDDQDGKLNGGTTYLTNVIYLLDDIQVSETEYNQRFNRATTRQVQLTVTKDTPTTLYYWCANHVGMGRTITVGLPGSGNSGGAQVDVSDTAPASPTEGNIWFNSTNGRIYVYVADGDSSQWVQPSVPVFSGDYNDLSNAPTSILDFSITDGSAGQILQTDGAGNFSFVAGTTYDQTLNTSDDVEFNTISATEFINTGVGTPEIDSASTLTLTAADGVIVNGSQFRLPSFTTTQRGNLVPINGDLIYNTTTNKVQAYQNGAWINLDDGSAA